MVGVERHIVRLYTQTDLMYWGPSVLVDRYLFSKYSGVVDWTVANAAKQKTRFLKSVIEFEGELAFKEWYPIEPPIKYNR